MRKSLLVVLVQALCCWSMGGAVAIAANGGMLQSSGAEIFLTFCSGCHGVDGFAEYGPAPSFAMGERLHKSDQELLASVLRGRHGMPWWEDKLTIDMFRRAIAYLRVMERRYQSGLPPRSAPVPDVRYRFKPVGEPEDQWMYRRR